MASTAKTYIVIPCFNEAARLRGDAFEGLVNIPGKKTGGEHKALRTARPLDEIFEL